MDSTDPGFDPEPPEPERPQSQRDNALLKPVVNLNRVTPTLIAIIKTSLLALTLFAFASPTSALNPSLKTTQYMHTSWRIQDGSLPAGMFSITQTTDGFLWFLTLSGDLYRFDGVSFAPLRIDTGPAGKIFADNSGGLWITGKELHHLQNGTVTSHFDLKGLHGFQTMALDADGSLWVGLRSSNTPLCHVKDGSVSCFGKDDGISIPDVNAILSDGTGGFWLGGTGTLLHWRHGGDSRAYPVKSLVTSLARAADGSLWIGSLADRGLAQLKQDTVTEFDTPGFNGSKITVTSLMTDRDGNLWVTTDANGVFRIRGTTVEHYGHTEGLSGDSAWDIFEDREGIVWGGTTSGVDSFRDPRVVTFSSTEGLGKDLAAGILATKDGSVWVANSESLDRIKDGVVSSIRKSDGLPGSQVASLLEDRAGNMWVGVDDGLYLFKDGRFRRLPEPDQKPLGMVVGITEDVDGNIWAECRSSPRKLVRIRDFQIKDVYDESRVPPGHNLAPDPHGGIWIETRDGDVLLLRNGTVETKIPVKRVGSSPLNRQIAPQPDGSILVGSENGLVGWRNNTTQTLTTKNGLPCDFVIAFTKDKQQQWWLYTRCGLVEFSDAELQKWWANPETKIETRMYDALDGAQPNIGSFNAAASTADGRVWFSSGVVVQMIEPAKLSPAARPAKAYIESLTVDRKEIATGGNVKLPPHPRDLSINYTSPTFLVSQRVRFRYRLDGYEQEWHDAGTRRQAFYSDLPPGNYSFSVLACNSDGVWSDSPTTFNFSITPAVYQTTWFRISLLLAFVALLWLAHQFRVRQLATQFNRTFEARVGERTRIARELHDTLLQSFQGLLLRLQSASKLLPDRPVEAKHRLDNALDQAAAAIAEGRDAVQGLRASAFETNDLANGITGIAEELTSSATATDAAVIEVEVEGTTRDLKPIVRDEAYRIAGEALRNAFRHAEAGRIKVEIRYDKQQFRLRVRDDGKGIDEDVMRRQPAGHFGLPGMRERAESVGGRLEVWTKLHAGTQIELSIPGTIAYDGVGRRSLPSREDARKRGMTAS